MTHLWQEEVKPGSMPQAVALFVSCFTSICHGWNSAVACDMWVIFISDAARPPLCSHTRGPWSATLPPSEIRSNSSYFHPPAAATFSSFVKFLSFHKICWFGSECESSRGTVRTQQQLLLLLLLALCTSLATFACGWWYLCRTNGCWWAEMVDSPRSFIYSPLMRSRQFDLRRCHMGRSYGGQAWYTVASQAFFQAFPWQKSVLPKDGNLDA